MQTLYDKKQQKDFYVAGDNTVFESKDLCEAYEKKNIYIKYISNLPRIENLPFLNNSLVDGFFCKDQQTIDICCNWWDENQKILNRVSITSGTFDKEDFYFIILNINTSNFSKNLYCYDMISFTELKKRWDYFCVLIPSSIHDIREQAESMTPEDFVKNLENIDLSKEKNIQKKFDDVYNKTAEELQEKMR